MDVTILAIGIRYTHLSTAEREKIFSTDHSLDEWVEKTYAKLSSSLFSEKLILLTCNRIEIYIVAQNRIQAEKEIKDILGRSPVYIYANQDAAMHIFRVACGIDSVVLGELEILSQVKKAYQQAIKAQAMGPILHQLLKDALYVGKESRTKTQIATGSQSIAHAIMTLVQKHSVNISQCQTLIIGAGEIAEQVTKNLVNHTNITLTNRTNEHALHITNKYGGKTIAFHDLEKSLPYFDVIVCATTSPQTLISFSAIKNIMKKRKQMMHLIDLAVPRNIDSQVAKIPHVHLSTLEDVQQVINKNRIIRQEAMLGVEALIETKKQKFWHWYATRETAPILLALTSKAHSIQHEELKKTLRKLHHLTQKDQEIISLFSLRIVNKLLADPITQIKRISYEKKDRKYIDMVKAIFELDYE